MKSGLRRYRRTKQVAVLWLELRKNGFVSSRNSLLILIVFRMSGKAVEGAWGAVRLIKHPWSLRLGGGAETLLMPGARSKRCRQARPLTGWVDSARARATGGQLRSSMQNPGRSRREALTHPSQGRHRPRSWLTETWAWMALCLPHCHGKRTEGRIEKGVKGVDF